jgi:hypothetical protein
MKKNGGEKSHATVPLNTLLVSCYYSAFFSVSSNINRVTKTHRIKDIGEPGGGKNAHFIILKCNKVA